MRLNSNIARNLALFLFSQAIFVCAQTAYVPFAAEPFDYNQGVLNGANGGSGWAGGWEVQNGSTAVPGYNVIATRPLTGTGAAQSPGYAVGGLNWQAAGRSFDTRNIGAFSAWSDNGLIGRAGGSLFMSLILRQDRSSNDEMSFTLHPGTGPAWLVSQPGISVGYFGGARFWALKLDGVVHPTKVAVVTGQPVLLVIRVNFATSGGGLSVISLFANPSPDTLPAKPDLSVSTATSVRFASAAWFGGSSAGTSSLDEIRVGASYSSLALRQLSVPTAPANLSTVPGDRQVALSWTPSPGATAYKVYQSSAGTPLHQATVTTGTFVQTGLTNGITYTFYVTAQGTAGTSLPSAKVTGTPRGLPPVPHASLGTNLSELKDYSRSWPFVDIFKMARPWIPQLRGAAWGQGPALQLDTHGWIKSLQPGQYAETIIFNNALGDQVHYPVGNYTLLYDGQGTIAFDLNSATITSQTPGRMVVNVPGGPDGIFLMVTATNPSNPIRNIRFIQPGFEKTYQTQPFHPLFLSRLDGYRALRFMEWQLTNGSSLKNWNDRAQVTDYSYVWRGVPLEILIQLANATNAAPWFNLPAQASDDFALQYATVIKKQLKPGRKFYVEYSNETWNRTFSQNQYMADRGRQLGLSSDPTVAVAYYTAYRSVQIFQIFRSVLGTASPMLRVIASQAANSWLSDQTLGFQNAFTQAEALAIAPYFNCSDEATGGFGMLGEPATAAQVAAMSVSKIMDIQLEHINGCARDQMTANAAVAHKYGLLLVGYEGGQSLVGFHGAENDTAMTSLFTQANRDVRMNELYSQYLRNWEEAGGDLLVHFNDVSAWTKYGSWGTLEFLDQAPDTSPKYQALHTFTLQHP